MLDIRRTRTGAPVICAHSPATITARLDSFTRKCAEAALVDGADVRRLLRRDRALQSPHVPRAAQRPLLVYTFAVTSALLVLVTDDVAWRYIPLTAFWREFVTSLSVVLFRDDRILRDVFLDLPKDDLKLGRIIYVLVALSALDLVAGLFPARPAWVDDVTLAFLVLLLLAILVAGVRAERRGYRGARFFIVGSAGVFIGVTINIVCETLALTVPEFVIELYAIGVAWEALWLTVALADRMNEVARENESLRLSRAELQVLAELDSLTGIPNRRAFDDHLQIGWTRALRAGTALGVIMIDVDHFKEYNDTHGHVAGDLCLFKIAQACVASMKRTGDFLARYGGGRIRRHSGDTNG